MPEMLYHYTCEHHLPFIMKSGFLKLTESNLREDKEGVKPVVWMTTTLEPKQYGLGLEVCPVDKFAVRIHIPMKSHFKHWKKFSRENKINKKWAKTLEEGRGSHTWWVSPEIIPLTDVVKIENTYTGQIYTYGGEK